MITSIKKKIASLIINNRLKHRLSEKKDFTSFFKNSFTFLVLMPSEEHDFNHALEVLNFLDEYKKQIYVMTYDYRVSLLPAKFKVKVHEHGIDDESQVGLPSKKLQERLRQMDYHVVIDLNRGENLFYSFIANTISAPIRIGFEKKGSDKYYNIQVKDESGEISYKNLLNCLRMF